MEEHAAPNIQNEYFNQVRREKTRVAVFLNNGRRLTGWIKSFDKFTVLLETSQGEQIVFKHAIATVGPSTTPSSARPRGSFNNRMDIRRERPQVKDAPASTGPDSPEPDRTEKSDP